MGRHHHAFSLGLLMLSQTPPVKSQSALRELSYALAREEDFLKASGKMGKDSKAHHTLLGVPARVPSPVPSGFHCLGAVSQPRPC